MKRLLIANRGEIARRIIRTATVMGIETVAVFSDADRHSPHVREATTSRYLGPAPARDSYLDPRRVLAAALDAAADALHPGYGFLSENAAFAEAVSSAGLTWVGPPASAIQAMGLKDAAKALMNAAGVPTTPGYLGDEQTAERLHAEANRIGYPMLIKAVAGGGGKGMRRVDAADGFATALASCKREATASFGDDRVLLETYVPRPRHIEVQVFADAWGNVVHLFERDCSLQRRHQKVIEEAPAPGLDEATRAAVTSAAIKAARAVNYRGAGTVEFIADGSGPLSADRIWFMEMNTRLQVEHPVTEMITGLDLVEWQIRVARGERLPLAQEDIALTGHAMEARLYAETPANNFLPSIGLLEHFRLPTPCDGVRIDAGVEQGGEVTPYYDPMIAKIIVHAETREAAAQKLSAACADVEVWPVKTNAGFLARCSAHPDFVGGHIDTGFIEARLEALVAPPSPSLSAAAAAALELVRLETRESEETPWAALAGAKGFRLNADPRTEVRLESAGRVLVTPLIASATGADHVMTVDDGVVVFSAGDVHAFRWPVAEGGTVEAVASGLLSSPMPGRIVAVEVEIGARVKAGQPIITLEAMKMEHTLVAPFDGKVVTLTVKAGDQVIESAVLAQVEGEV